MAVITKTNTTIKTLFDLSVELYGDVSYSFKLLEYNPSISDLQAEISVGEIITYDDAFVIDLNFEKSVEATAKYFTAKESQSVFDLAIQLYGSVDYVFQLLEDNTNLGDINNEFCVGVNIKYEEQTFAITEYFRTNRIYITTGTNIGRSFDDSFSFSFN